MPTTAAVQPDPPDLLRRLQSLCRGRELGALAARLAGLADLVAPDVARFEKTVPSLRPEASAVERGAQHLVDLGGKRLRPICVALAARLGTGFDERALQLAVAVEMVHAATLLHDDVVDVGDTRRGAPAARMIFGNAVSIFAGDWLLIDALKRVRKAEVDGVLERLLDVIEEMILAESLQLERRGRLDTTQAQWFDIVDGKTAALFRWAMFAGGKAGGASDAECEVLETYGRHLGVAFQAIDDLLDLAGNPDETGKALFTDLREGKLTYPLIVSLGREPALEPLLRDIIGADESTPEQHRQHQRVLAILDATGSLDECRKLALDHAARAKDALGGMPPSRAKDALLTVADATVHRPS
ncbi:MAG: polyprenyl synthetase family protein [Sandaracinaceae bacterium]|nr:MAG: polyprenyl synthetase family protein [Sandaracinaceae bacterium]